jgi:epoxyqueuosine reductase
MPGSEELTHLIKQRSSDLGFEHCGIARADFLSDHEQGLKEWLARGLHADMAYMNRNTDKRLDPRLLLDGAKSVIVVGLNYFPGNTGANTDSPLFSKYSYGSDYHRVIKDRLYILLSDIKKFSGDIKGRVFVDSAPVLERAWAARAGLGWQGKNSMLINRDSGSYFFIGTIITDAELEYESVNIKDYCGTCSVCIKSCPTQAITEKRTIDSSRCISYLTIERRGEFEDSDTDLNGYVFGCDICQDVCPWNRKAKPTTVKEFSPLPEIMEYTTGDWKKITEDEFNNIFRSSPVLRTGYKGFIRNLEYL